MKTKLEVTKREQDGVSELCRKYLGPWFYIIKKDVKEPNLTGYTDGICEDEDTIKFWRKESKYLNDVILLERFPVTIMKEIVMKRLDSGKDALCYIP